MGNMLQEYLGGTDGSRRRNMFNSLKSFWLRFRERLINFYPPLFGAGIRSHNIDEFTIGVEMKLTFLNRNIVGSHFGGSLYAMCDPWFMLILMRILGPEYVVWDKAASIQFLQPGRGKVNATFHIPQVRINEIRLEIDHGQTIEPTFIVDVLDAQNQPIAHIEKLLYIRKK
jgi:acyl-coenzyme A thioesterase PaaI-like protein